MRLVSSERWKRLRQNVTLMGNVMILLVFFVLDIRDLHFKLAWLGPYDSFAFSAVGRMRIEAAPLVPVHPLPSAPREIWLQDSGWGSYWEKCESLQGSGFFLELVGKNCSTGDPHNPQVIETLVLSGAVRVDAIAWACCKLLFYHRRPSICQERIVTGFIQRYRFEDHRVPVRSMAPADSAAEREVLQLLGVISRSSPLFRTVCVQAFAFSGAGEYRPTLFGCGSPSVFESAFAGHAASYLRELLHDKAWLTVDVLNIMGLQFIIRQNDVSVFAMYDTQDGVVTGDHLTQMNFSASGQLYAFVVAIDILIAILHVLGALEIFRVVLRPSFRSAHDHQQTHHHHQDQLRGDESSCLSIFSRSLCRSRPVVLLTTLSHLISWQIILPNAVVWTWTGSQKGKLLAYMSSIRVWVLLLLSFNTLWDGVVFLNEKWAYAFASKTFLTTVELMAVGAAVAFVNRADLFSMSEKKYAIEHQRLIDTTSFVNGVGFADVYNDDNNGIGVASGELYTSRAVLETVYGPLLRILARSLASLGVFLLLKMAVLQFRRRLRQPRVASSARVTNRAASGTESLRRPLQPPKPKYTQLEAEELMGVAIRARSLIRNTYDMELQCDGVTYVSVPLFFDFGVLLDESGLVRPRIGFVGGVIPASIDVTPPDGCLRALPFSTIPAAGPHWMDVPQLSFTLNPLTRRPSSIALALESRV